MKRRALLLALPALAIRPVLAAPVPYALDTQNSRVAFSFKVAGQSLNGTMPIAFADIHLDLADIAASRVAATLNASRARTGLPLATEALTGPGILHAARHPLITFRSTSIRVEGIGGEMDGDLTVRGVTRPVTLNAQLYRRRDTEDPGSLTIRMSGEISRTAFGASAMPDLVADAVALDILARITRAA